MHCMNAPATVKALKTYFTIQVQIPKCLHSTIFIENNYPWQTHILLPRAVYSQCVSAQRNFCLRNVGPIYFVDFSSEQWFTIKIFHFTSYFKYGYEKNLTRMLWRQNNTAQDDSRPLTSPDQAVICLWFCCGKAWNCLTENGHILPFSYSALIQSAKDDGQRLPLSFFFFCVCTSVNNKLTIL